MRGLSFSVLFVLKEVLWSSEFYSKEFGSIWSVILDIQENLGKLGVISTERLF